MPPTAPGPITPHWSASPTAPGAVQGAAGSSPTAPGAVQGAAGSSPADPGQGIGDWAGTPTAASNTQTLSEGDLTVAWVETGGVGNGRSLVLTDDGTSPIVVSDNGNTVGVDCSSAAGHELTDVLAALASAGLGNYTFSGLDLTVLVDSATFFLSGGVDGGAVPTIPGAIV